PDGWIITNAHLLRDGGLTREETSTHSPPQTRRSSCFHFVGAGYKMQYSRHSLRVRIQSSQFLDTSHSFPEATRWLPVSVLYCSSGPVCFNFRYTSLCLLYFSGM